MSDACIGDSHWHWNRGSRRGIVCLKVIRSPLSKMKGLGYNLKCLQQFDVNRISPYIRSSCDVPFTML